MLLNLAATKEDELTLEPEPPRSKVKKEDKDLIRSRSYYAQRVFGGERSKGREGGTMEPHPLSLNTIVQGRASCERERHLRISIRFVRF